MQQAQLDLTYLTDVRPSGYEDAAGGDSHEGGELRTAFDRLVLPDGHKDVILSLVTQHFRDKKSAKNEGDYADIVRGKGTTYCPPTHTPRMNAWSFRADFPFHTNRKGADLASSRRARGREDYHCW